MKYFANSQTNKCTEMYKDIKLGYNQIKKFKVATYHILLYKYSTVFYLCFFYFENPNLFWKAPSSALAPCFGSRWCSWVTERAPPRSNPVADVTQRICHNVKRTRAARAHVFPAPQWHAPPHPAAAHRVGTELHSSSWLFSTSWDAFKGKMRYSDLFFFFLSFL